MKPSSIFLLFAFATFVASSVGPLPAEAHTVKRPTPETVAGSTHESPAEHRIAAARRAIAAQPNNVKAHNALAFALTRRARELGDHHYYFEADKVLETSFKLAPDNLEALRIQAWSLLGQHEFERALAAAEELQKQVPDDVQAYGLLADAYTQLGRYQDAEEAVQWMLDLRPGNVAGLTRGAYLREIHGDVDGAIDWMQQALQRLPPHELEDRAWTATRIAALYRSRGDLERAEAWLRHADEVFPNYHYTLAEWAELHSDRGNFEQAVSIRRRHYAQTAHAEDLYYLARALERAGQAEDAERAFEQFEAEAGAETEGADNANGELAAYFIEHGRIDEALALTKREVERRATVSTLRLRAQALLRAERHEEAREAIEAALASGQRDAELYQVAAEIHQALGAQERANDLRQESIRINPLATAAGH